MNNGGDAAEQIVRLSLEGFEVAAKLTGSAAKNVALLLVSVLKQEQQTKGKARLTNMIRSGKELKVFSLPQKDIQKFTEQAKRYGVLYCLLRDKNTRAGDAPVPRTLPKYSGSATALNSARSTRRGSFPKRKRTRQTGTPWRRKSLPRQGARSSWSRQWVIPCRKKGSPTKTLRSQRRKKALRPSEAQRLEVQMLTGVQQSRQTKSLPCGKSWNATRLL